MVSGKEYHHTPSGRPHDEHEFTLPSGTLIARVKKAEREAKLMATNFTLEAERQTRRLGIDPEIVVDIAILGRELKKIDGLTVKGVQTPVLADPRTAEPTIVNRIVVGVRDNKIAGVACDATLNTHVRETVKVMSQRLG